jgi:hypothetical protein
MACSHDGSGESVGTQTPATLSIYVYTPDNPFVRSNTDWVTGTSRITSLQLWVFESTTGNLVGYFTPSSTDELMASRSAVYQMAVTPQFVQTKPNVDVYVMANVTQATCGCSYGETTTREELDEAVLRYVDDGHDYFGLTNKVTEEPSTGFPMSGVLKNQKVTGSSPVFQVGEGALASVKLVRSVSRVRFIFSQMRNEEGHELRINSVSLTGEEETGYKIIPKQEYLFLTTVYTGGEWNLPEGVDYETGPKVLASGDDIPEIPYNDNPLHYAYKSSMGAQEYENLIASGLTKTNTRDPELAQVGPYYLRETDQKLTGEIKYSIDNGAERTATFAMHHAGDFSRNHTWTVYAHYSVARLEVLVVGIQAWINAEVVNHEVYNW